MNLMPMLQNVIMNNSNPILANAIQLAQNGDKEGVDIWKADMAIICQKK